MNRERIKEIQDGIQNLRRELRKETAKALPVGTRVSVVFTRSVVEGVVLLSGNYDDEVQIENEKTGKKRQFKASWNAWNIISPEAQPIGAPCAETDK